AAAWGDGGESPQSDGLSSRCFEDGFASVRSGPARAYLREFAVLHYFADPASLFRVCRPHRRDPHRDSAGSCVSTRGASRNAGLRLSFGAYEIFFEAHHCVEDSARRIPAAARSRLSAGEFAATRSEV